jgi:hypothetical protein
MKIKYINKLIPLILQFVIYIIIFPFGLYLSTIQLGFYVPEYQSLKHWFLPLKQH